MSRNLLKLAGIWVLATALGSCVTVSPSITDMGELETDELLLIGKIDLIPPFVKMEQNFSSGMGFGAFENGIGFYLGNEVVMPDTRNPGGNNNRFLVRIGEDFYIKSKRSNPLFYSAAFTQLSADLSGTMRFPGAFRFEIPPGAKTVYVGTIRYHRNEYMEITKVEIIDEFQRVRGEFEAKFGRVPLARSKTSLIKN